jgi:5-bromo-4-chloroindolyl phosphate hydrolysis protein
MNSRNNNNGSSDIFSWIVIFILFGSGAWPIALFLLIRKLFASDVPKGERREAPPLTKAEKDAQQDEELERIKKKIQQKQNAEKAKEAMRSFVRSPKEDKSSSAILTIAGALIMAAGAFLGFSAIGATGDIGLQVWTALGTFLGGGCMFASGILMKRTMQRQATYLAILGPNEAMEIAVIAKKAGVSKKQAEKDLQRMIDKGYFGESAYINKELGYIFMSNRADEELTAARKAAMEKTREATKLEAAKQNASAYDQILAQIRDVNERIPDPAMTEKITEIEEITREIFRAVEQEPEKRGKIDRFMSYFLPTTLKLLESYASMEKTSVGGKNINQSKHSIEVAMDTIVEGFRHQLDELYKTDAVSIETEVDVLTKMINRETATAKQEFGLGGQAVQQQTKAD